MLRLFLLLNLFLLNLYACKGGYDSCKLKLLDSKAIHSNSIHLPIAKNQRLVYSKTTPKEKILKTDPFLNLYLVEDKKGFKYPFIINKNAPLGMASVNERDAIEGKITRAQIGLNSLALFSEVISYPSVLTNSCCSLEGIVTPEGIIEKDYINRFLHTKDTRYSDIGIRVKQSKKCVEVLSVDPYFLDNPFRQGDCIIELNSKKVTDAASFMKSVLFSKIGSKHKVKVKRDSKIYAFNLTSYERHGGGYLSDTYLEQKGIFFDNELNVVKIEREFKNYELKVGDKLLTVNGVRVHNKQELINYMSKYKDFSFLLIEREHFQFFVKIN